MNLLQRGVSLPYLVDWDRDGHTDLVIGYWSRWEFLLIRGPLRDRRKFVFQRVSLPSIPNASPTCFAFADWDGDGRLDLLVGVVRTDGAARKRSVYWLRNLSDKGPPKFAEAARLLDLPAPWELDALTTVKWGGDVLPSLVVSVGRDWRQEGGAANELWLFRRKAGSADRPRH